MKKLLFMLTFFFAAVACDNGTENTRPLVITPGNYEIEAGEGGVYTFTTNVPAYLNGCRVTKSNNEILFNEDWKKPMKLPKTFEKTWFTLTQRDDTTFEITIDENHDSGLVLIFGLFPYVLGADTPHSIFIYLQ